MDSGALRSARPPAVRCSAIDIAVVVLFLAAAYSGLLLVGAVAALTVGVRGASDARSIVNLAVSVPFVIASVVVAVGLQRRRLWAWRVAVTAFAVVSVAGVVWIAVMLAGWGPTGHGAGYVFIGSLQFVGLAVLILVLLVRPNTRQSLRGPEARWYRDPLHERVWRYWDGSAWTTHVG